MAVCVTRSSRPARVKLPSRAEASKARKALSGNCETSIAKSLGEILDQHFLRSKQRIDRLARGRVSAYRHRTRRSSADSEETSDRRPTDSSVETEIRNDDVDVA